MFFKNARPYRFTKPFQISAEQLEEKLQAEAFTPCGQQETSRWGWVSPLGKQGEQMVHAAGGYMLICLQRQEKILPPGVIREEVDERAEAIEIAEGRKVRRKERDEIKEQVVLEMLPRAFVKNKKVYGYLALRDGYMVVDANPRAADDFASFLRKALGSLPVRPPAVNQSPAFTFTGWLNETIELPEKIVLGSDCWMTDPSEDGGKVIARGLDLRADEVRNHLEAGMQATKLTMTWDDNVSLCLDENFCITRLKFGETIQEQLDDVDADDALARFDAGFCLMTEELNRLIPGLLDALGGEDRSAITESDGTNKSPLANAVKFSGQPPAMYSDDRDPLYAEAVQLVTETGKASFSMVQRKFKIGFNRACNLIDSMEANGVVSSAGHNGARTVLADHQHEALA